MYVKTPHKYILHVLYVQETILQKHIGYWRTKYHKRLYIDINLVPLEHFRHILLLK